MFFDKQIQLIEWFRNDGKNYKPNGVCYHKGAVSLGITDNLNKLNPLKQEHGSCMLLNIDRQYIDIIKTYFNNNDVYYKMNIFEGYYLSDIGIKYNKNSLLITFDSNVSKRCLFNIAKNICSYHFINEVLVHLYNSHKVYTIRSKNIC